MQTNQPIEGSNEPSDASSRLKPAAAENTADDDLAAHTSQPSALEDACIFDSAPAERHWSLESFFDDHAPHNAEDRATECRRLAADSSKEEIIRKGLTARKQIQDLIGIALQDRIELELHDGTLVSKAPIPNENFPFAMKDLEWLVLTVPFSKQGSSELLSLYGHLNEQAAVADAFTQNLTSHDLRIRSWPNHKVQVFSSADQVTVILAQDEELLHVILSELAKPKANDR
jgi:hypothetical protein